MKIMCVVLALALTGCAGISKEDKAAIASLTPEQRQQLAYEMLKAKYATPRQEQVYVQPAYQPYEPPHTYHTVCPPSSALGMSYCITR